MVAVTDNSSLRVQRFTSNKIKDGFKRVHRWVFDLNNVTFQEQLKQDLLNYKVTNEANEWDDFASEQLSNIEGWK